MVCCSRGFRTALLAVGSVNSEKLFRFERKIGRHVAALDFDFLCRRRTNWGRFAMTSLEGVFAVGHILDGVFAVLVADCEVGMIHHANVSEHPRMHVAFEAQEGFGGREAELQFRTVWHLRWV